jgi:hypothetical protein
MRYPPFRTSAIAEKLRAGHKKHPPTSKPTFGFDAVGRSENRQESIARGIHAVKPRLEGAGVMGAVHLPLALHLEMLVPQVRQIGRGHDTAGEEMAGHPVGWSVIGIGVRKQPVAKDVLKETAIGPQPAGDALEKTSPVPHMFEHFHRHDAVKTTVSSEAVHVFSQHLYTVETLGCTAIEEVPALNRRIGDRKHAAARIVASDPHAHGTPAAPEIQHIHAVLDSGPSAAEVEHCLLCRCQITHSFGPPARRILEQRSKHGREKLGWQFVMLLVGCLRCHCDRR